MKKIIFTLMACAALWACADDEITVKGGEESGAQLDGDVAYITVNINPVTSSYSRATDGGYAYGTDAESAVSSASFYFYDADGDYVTSGSVTSPTFNEGTVVNIEKTSDIVVAVWGLEGDFPKYMVTIINEPTGFVHGATLEAMCDVLTDSYKNGDYFIMSSSTYASNNAAVYYTELADENFAMEPTNVSSDYGDGGEYTAVDVYVERLAAKVTVTLDETLYAGGNIIDSDNIVSAMDIIDDMTTQGLRDDELYIKFLGYGLDGTSRDSYVIKNIDPSSWSGLTFVYNSATNFRSYWAMSPNYSVDVEYPESSNGNTDSDESDSSTWLNDYLKYSSLAEVTEFGDDEYCLENTNTTDLLDEYISAKTHALVKAQLGLMDNGTFTPVDMLRYHGEYFEEQEFMEDMVEKVMEYDFEVICQEVIAYLEEHYPTLSSYTDILMNALESAVYYTSEELSDVEVFSEKFLKLINMGDGYVNIWLNSTPSQWTNGYSPGDNEYHDLYEAPNLLDDGLDMDDYKLYFKFAGDSLTDAVKNALNILELTSLIKDDGTDYYLSMDSELITITTEAGHIYTLRNYLIRALEHELASINEDAGNVNYYKNGLMYYAVPIEHLGTSTNEDVIVEGQYGVVRNAWYNLTVYNVAGIGHGIAVEDEVIVPIEEPDYYYLGAVINILSWDKIDQSVTLK